MIWCVVSEIAVMLDAHFMSKATGLLVTSKLIKSADEFTLRLHFPFDQYGRYLILVCFVHLLVV